VAKKTKECLYYVKGMHCASCEILIEKKLLEIENVKSVEASTAKGEVLIEYEGNRPSPERLNKIFSARGGSALGGKKEGYVFSDLPAGKAGQPQEPTNGFKTKESLITIGIGLLIIIGFIGLNKLGLSGLINVSSKSSLPVFFVFGLVAGVSSCAALVGGIILSMSKQWSELYSDTDTTWKKLQPNLIFNAGRLISYGVFGAVLGAIGSKLNFSLKFGPILVIVVSAMMIFLAFRCSASGRLGNFNLRCRNLSRDLLPTNLISRVVTCRF